MPKHKTSTRAPYRAFGERVIALRVAAGISLQSDLAKLVGSSQQTVSRWEAGVSRPRFDQVSKLAMALNADAHDLLVIAGYRVKPAVISFDQPFPIDALAPESFERFTEHLLSALYPGAKVIRMGGQGHKQDGLDVLLSHPDGRRHTFQCKRVNEFGPQKVHEAVAKHAASADRKFLLLTRTASPDARRAVDMHSDWELWDREDISRKVRELPVNDQRRLVRIFFSGQELALLGKSPESPWETPQEFFQAFSRDDTLFNHVWQLVGRDGSVSEVSEALSGEHVDVVFLTGAGGSGKSRLVKEILVEFCTAKPATMVRVLSTTGELTKANLQELGSTQKLLVVDDAHDRSDLQVLFEHVAINAGRVKLLLAFRRYGLEHIKAQASGYSLSGDRVRAVDLPPLSKADAEKLALQVLQRHGGPIEAAKDIANLTYDCPLATVVAAHLVAKGDINPSLAQTEDEFRSTLFGRFERVIAGHLGDSDHPHQIQMLLGFIALVQPIHLDDDDLFDAFAREEKVPLHDAKRLLKVLVEAGVLFKRGAKYRLSPDVLGDYLIEARCVGPEGRSTGYAERIFDELDAVHIEKLLLNLGRLDWRRTDRRTDDSPLLDGIWKKLKPSNDYADPHIRAVKAVAYYQPKRALEFVERLIETSEFRNQIAEIAKYAAYTGEHLARALECLWELGRNDIRETNPHPAHPIRILSELAEPQPNKPLAFNAAVLDFGLKLAQQPDCWRNRFSPLDILDSLLKTEGHLTASEGHSIHFTPFFVSPEHIRPLREKVIDFTISLLSDADSRKAARAARSLADALRYPLGMFGNTVRQETRSAWGEQFADTVRKIHDAVKTQMIDPIVQFEIGRSVGWHAGFGSGETAKLARHVIASLSPELDFRTVRALIDGYGMEDRRAHQDGHEKRWASLLNELVRDLIAKYPSSDELLSFIETMLIRVAESESGRDSSPGFLIGKLIQEVPGFAEAIVIDAMKNPALKISRFASFALAQVFRQDRDAGRRNMQLYVSQDRADLQASVGLAFQNLSFDGGWFNKEDFNTLAHLLESVDEWVVLTAVRSLRRLAEYEQATVFKLARGVAIRTTRIADEVATLFEFGQRLSYSILSKEDVQSILDQLELLPELDGHWLDKLLAHFSETFPWECARFFMRRVESAADSKTRQMRPCNYGPWKHEPLRFRRSPEGANVMREVAQWMKRNQDSKGMFGYYSRSLFEAMFGPYDADIVRFLEEWLASAQEEDIRLIASILREADQDFVFEQSTFVTSFLERAKQFGPNVHRVVSGELYCSAISGTRSGTSGQPFPEDINLKNRADAVLATVARFSPAFSLYDGLKQHAEGQIHRAIREAEDLEE